MSQSLYDQLGGFSAVRKFVSEFYDRVLDEEDLAPFFANTDMAKLVDHQTKFFATLLGGPSSYTDKQLSTIHAARGIQKHHFRLLRDLVVKTLEDHDVDAQHVEDVSRKWSSYESAMVTKDDE